MELKKLLIISLCLLAAVLYGVRVYNVNHSPILEYMPNKIVNEAGTRVGMPAGYYNTGYVDLSGYNIQVVGTRLAKTEDVLAEIGSSMDFFDQIEANENCQYVYIVTAIFDYDGEGDPTENAVDLSIFKLVGPDYYFNFDTMLNKQDGFNPKLQNNCMFSIGSGKPIEVELPFLIDTESEWSVSPEYLAKTNPKLLISQYPDEVYIELGKLSDQRNLNE